MTAARRRDRHASRFVPPLAATIPHETRPLFETLERDERFHRDGRLGRLFHPGTTSFREVSPTESLHVIIDGNKVSAHVDDVSPVLGRPDGTVRYPLARVVAHNLAGIAADFGRRLSGRRGEQRCKLECEAVWVEDEPTEGPSEARPR